MVKFHDLGALKRELFSNLFCSVYVCFRNMLRTEDLYNVIIYGQPSYSREKFMHMTLFQYESIKI